jgi:hypothetical protein
MLEWMADSGQARWDAQQHAVVLTHLVWLRESGLATVDYVRHTLVLGDAGDAMVPGSAAGVSAG